MKNEGKTKKLWTDFEGKKLPLLPPCRVCGEKASGLHYGVNTCEACKVICFVIFYKLLNIVFFY